MEDLDVNVAIWRVLMNATLKAAIHLRNNHDVNWRYVKNYCWRSTGQLFREIENLISCQTETSSISLIDSEDLRWISTCLLHSPACQYVNANFYAFSDSVLCLGRIGRDPSMVFEQSFQRYESNWWKSHGVRVEDFHRIHDSGHPQWDSENNKRITGWSSGLQRQDHLHVNV